MTDEGKTTFALNTITGPYNNDDRLVLLYGTDTANTGNSVAQTATISIYNLLSNTANLTGTFANLQTAFQQSDPSSATAWSGLQGTIFFSNTYGYVAIANNILRRWTISSF